MTEAEWMFDRFVHLGAASRELLHAYEAALHALGIEQDPLTDRLVCARADLASAELALRFRHPDNGLTKRGLLMTALAEARPEYSALFAAKHQSPARAWMDLALAPITGLIQLSKGRLLVWWHGGRV